MAKAVSPHTLRPDLALLIPSYAGGGAERTAFFIAGSLADEGLRVDLVVARSRGELRDIPLPDGVGRVELGSVNELLAAPAWIRYLRMARPRAAMSMVHSANFNSGVGGLFVRDVPFVVNLRVALDCEPAAQWWVRRRVGFWPERILYERAARIVGVSRGVADEAARLFAISPDKVVAIPNPRKRLDCAATIASEHEPFFDRPVVLSAGRLEPQKNYRMLLHAFAETVLKHDVHLLILGEGSERSELQKLVHALGLDGRVLLPGFVKAPEAYMRRARVFVLSSRNEGFPCVLVEAMDAGTAIVSTDCPFGPSEILDEGRFGTLVPPGDAGAFAAALQAELDRADVGHRARRAERARWMEQFDPEIVTRSYLDLVQDVIAESEAAMLGSEVLRIK